MAKPYQNANTICLILTIIAALGIILGFATANAVYPVLLLLPTAGYEVYRTEGKSTKFASLVMLAVLIAELAFILFGIQFNVARYLGDSGQYISGYYVPFGDIKVLAPALMAVAAIILVTNTRGKYTKWLAIIIFVNAFAIVHVVDPSAFQELLKVGIRQGIRSLRF
ncbi:MAG: hypothetical protein ACOC6Q_02190 [Patescibacteria group bacterium]